MVALRAKRVLAVRLTCICLPGRSTSAPAGHLVVSNAFANASCTRWSSIAPTLPLADLCAGANDELSRYALRPYQLPSFATYLRLHTALVLFALAWLNYFRLAFLNCGYRHRSRYKAGSSSPSSRVFFATMFAFSTSHLPPRSFRTGRLRYSPASDLLVTAPLAPPLSLPPPTLPPRRATPTRKLRISLVEALEQSTEAVEKAARDHELAKWEADEAQKAFAEAKAKLDETQKKVDDAQKKLSVKGKSLEHAKEFREECRWRWRERERVWY